MLNEKIEERYAPGRRENSFFMDMPVKKRKERKSAPIAANRIAGYTYYINANGDLIREAIN